MLCGNFKRPNKDDEKLCNSQQRENCPTDGKCLTKNLVYKAEVTSTEDNTRQTYIGVTANDLRQDTETIYNPYATKSTNTKRSYPNTFGS